MENLAAMNMKKTSTSAPAMAPATGIEYLHTFLAFVLFLHGPWNNEFVFRLHIPLFVANSGALNKGRNNLCLLYTNFFS